MMGMVIERSRRVFWALALTACGGGGGSPDAGAPDASLPGADASPDASPDAAVVDFCPNRTAPVGQPEGPVPTEAIHAGDVTIRTALDVQALAGKRVITGSLYVEGTDVPTIVLPD